MAIPGLRRIVAMKIWKPSGNAVKVAGAAALLCSGLLLVVLGVAARRGSLDKPATVPTGPTRPSHAKQDSHLLEDYGKLPLSFEENQGQTAQEVRYVARGGNYELFLTPQEAVVALHPPEHFSFSPKNRFKTLRAIRELRRNARQTNQTAVLRLRLEGGNLQPQISGSDLLPGKVNYFIGNDPKKWHTEVPTYAKVRYANVYPGVDLVFYGSDRRLEYDFIVAPGANPAAIALNVQGARRMRVNSRGDVMVGVPGGEVELQKPVIYQIVKGERREIAGGYHISADQKLTFSVPKYDRNEPLVLDPVLNYSTYVGGSGSDFATGIALDSTGNAYITGVSYSTDFPTTPNGLSQQPLAANAGMGAVAAFVAKLNPAGTTLLYSSYIAGSTPGETAFGIAVNPAGNAVYVTGQTFSPDFPTNSTIA
jgi:hypothetical protein